MKVAGHIVNVVAQIQLDKRELELLHHISSYDCSAFAKSIESGHYHGGVKAAEIVEFFSKLRMTTGEMMARIEDAGSKLFDRK